MGKNSDLFLMMKEQDLASMSKKELELTAHEHYQRLIDDGEYNEYQTHKVIDQVLTYFGKMKSMSEETVRRIMSDKSHIDSGVEFSIRQGYAKLDYNSDEVYSSIEEKLKERKALLDLAYKSKDMIFDSEGVEVPKVQVKSWTKDSLIIKY